MQPPGAARRAEPPTRHSSLTNIIPVFLPQELNVGTPILCTVCTSNESNIVLTNSH